MVRQVSGWRLVPTAILGAALWVRIIGGVAVMERFFARSASDKTDDWDFWFVADRTKGGLNVTAELLRACVNPAHVGGTLLTRDHAVKLADLNAARDKARAGL